MGRLFVAALLVGCLGCTGSTADEPAEGSRGTGGSADTGAAPSTTASGTATDAAMSSSTGSASGQTTEAGTEGGGSTDDPATSGDPTGGTDSGTDTGDAPMPEDGSAPIFAPDAMPRFELEIPQASARALSNDPNVYAEVTFRYGSEVLERVGARLKGEASFRDLSGKSAFKLKFDAFVPGQTFRGLKRLTLNNAMEAESFIVERLSYEVYRAAGLAAPRANNARLYVNGDDWGVYVNVETEDKIFLARWYADPGGNLYEEQGEEFLPGNETKFELETNEMANDRSDLRALIAAVDAASPGTWEADLAGVLDTKQFLRYSAAECLVNQWDGYSYTRYWPNNFRIYADPKTRRFTFLPWGHDMSMATRPETGEFHMPVWDVRGIILDKCVRGAACREAFRKQLVELADVFEGLDLPAKVEIMYRQIQAAVFADPRKEIDNDTFNDAILEVKRFVVERPDEVRSAL